MVSKIICIILMLSMFYLLVDKILWCILEDTFKALIKKGHNHYGKESNK